jgi:hypothetical protein
MSVVDTQFSADQRQAYLAEVRYFLPAFLSAAATEQPDPVGDVKELLNLRDRDLGQVIATHLALSEPIRRLGARLADGLRRPITSSVRPREPSRSVRGPIDWGATVRLRAGVAGDPTMFVIRPARRVFDTPENRVLAWVVEELDRQLRRAAPSPESPPEERTWLGEIISLRSRLLYARSRTWLRDVPPAEPSPAAIKRLRAARTAFYAIVVPEAVGLLRRFVQPSPEDITELLSERWFLPARDWQLFELLVTLRLARAFAATAEGKRKTRLLTGAGKAPVARYALKGGDEILLWYQSWPDMAGGSRHWEAIQRHQIRGAGGLRPDIVIERRGTKRANLILELKGTKSGSYLGAGIAQLLGYLHDRPDMSASRLEGWLVAPSSEAFDSAPRGSDDLWLVDADHVGAAAVECL